MLAKYALFLQRAITRPYMAQGYVREYFAYRKTSSLHQRRIGEYQLYLHTLEDGISLATGKKKASVESLLNSPALVDLHLETQTLTRRDPGCIPLSDDADFRLAQASYCVTRLLLPHIVIETGVAHGITSAFILQALADNGKGHLYSIDLPALHRGVEAFTGIAVSERLKSRWTLILEDSRHALPKILRGVDRIDMFLHDSSHIYSDQMWEYNSIWPHLRPGGVLLSDDLINDAFIEFAETQQAHPIVITQPAKNRLFGMLVKM